VIESVNHTFKGQLDLEQHGVTPPVASGFGSYSAFWPSPQRSGTTTRPASPPAITGRLRPLIPWNRSSRRGLGRRSDRLLASVSIPTCRCCRPMIGLGPSRA
jgi:hypothetical protein